MNIKVSLTRQENAEFFNANIGDTVEVDFEDYVAAVVASEIGNSPIEACRAQAIAARSYAVNKGVLRGKAISDSSATAQAYRAKRNNTSTYPNAVQGTKDTAGMVLTYKGSVINAVYSSNNGGITTSSKERWGNTCAYLIEQADPWDAADGRTKTGHGVGMSQRGAMWAANQGVSYKDILAFYYPGTALSYNYGDQQEVKTMTNEKANDIVNVAKSKLGDPYVYGAWGDLCTPSKRKQYAGYHPEYRSNIYDACPVLSGKQGSCSGCKWEGHLCYDCRGFSHYCVLNGSGIDIEGAGATSQYNEMGNWEERGKLEDAPNLVCCVFKKKDSKMSHTGVHIGNGQIIHCSTTVKEGMTTDSGWTHYAIPKGLYTEDEIKNAQKLQTVINEMKGVTSMSYNPATDGYLYMARVYASNGGTVNFRSGASTGASIIKRLSVNTEVYVLEEVSSTWAKIAYNGTVGYMMRSYLVKKIEDTTAPTPAETPAPTGGDTIQVKRETIEAFFALREQVEKLYTALKGQVG